MSKKKKKNGAKLKVPKKILGLKLSKGSRKDLRKAITLIGRPEARGLAISAASIAFGYLAEKTAAAKGPAAKLVNTSPEPRPN